jgi:hypothetical protein
VSGRAIPGIAKPRDITRKKGSGSRGITDLTKDFNLNQLVLVGRGSNSALGIATAAFLTSLQYEITPRSYLLMIDGAMLFTTQRWQECFMIDHHRAKQRRIENEGHDS